MQIERFTSADEEASHENNVCTICREEVYKTNFDAGTGLGRPVFSNFPAATWKVFYNNSTNFAISCNSHLVDELNFLVDELNFVHAPAK